MPDIVRPTGTVHWAGAGLSCGSGLRLVAGRAARTFLWNRTVSRAEDLLGRLGITDRAVARPFDEAAFTAAIMPGDIVVSMLPPPSHPDILKLCLQRGAHFACTSYASPATQCFAPALAQAGLVAMMEAGLDPGIDHLLAHELVARAQAATGSAAYEVSFQSYCGGLTAVPNEFCYRFSWAPLGVLQALKHPAQFIAAYQTRLAARPWEETQPYEIGGEVFEVYPNRDSLPYLSQYQIPPAWRIQNFVRGTLRPRGWRAAWQEVFSSLQTGDDTALAELACRLAERYPATRAHHDRVVLNVKLTLAQAGDIVWAGQGSIDSTGDADETAMARHVSITLACGVTDILDGFLTPGFHRASEATGATPRWLQRLAGWGVKPCIESTMSASVGWVSEA